MTKILEMAVEWARDLLLSLLPAPTRTLDEAWETDRRIVLVILLVPPKIAELLGERQRREMFVSAGAWPTVPGARRPGWRSATTGEQAAPALEFTLSAMADEWDQKRR